MSRRLKLLVVAELVGVVAFFALMIAAIALYPGGTFMDRTTRGHRFFENFVCDVQQPIALNGTANPVGSFLGQAAMFVLFASWLPYWSIVGRTLSAPRAALWARRLGIVAAAFACAIPLLPSERFGRLHAVAIFAAAFPGLGALLISVGELLRDRGVTRAVRFSSGFLAIAAFADAALYAWHTITESAVTIALPALQKVASLALFAWMALVTFAAINRERAGSTTRR